MQVDFIWKLVALMLFLGTLVGGGYKYGYDAAVERYRPPLEACEGREKGEKEAGEKRKEEWEKQNEILKASYNDDVLTLTNRLLELDMQGQTSCTATKRTKEVNGSTKERTFTTTIEKCALDAQQVNGWIEWARLHSLPVE